MKSKNLLTIAIVACSVAMFSSCSSDDDHADGCHECHIALENADGSETMWHIESPSGGEEFCGQELENAESSSYVYTVTDTLYCEEMGCILLPGEYGPGSANSEYEIHCEEHADH